MSDFIPDFEQQSTEVNKLKKKENETSSFSNRRAIRRRALHDWTGFEPETGFSWMPEIILEVPQIFQRFSLDSRFFEMIFGAYPLKNVENVGKNVIWAQKLG